MAVMDFIVIAIYLVMLLTIGWVFSTKIKTSSDMFVAGRQSPWWVAGISSYMSIFSAGTFVVWGGIAYDFGFVAISICLSYGVGAFLTGLFVAGKWRKMGLSTAGEFIKLRFGMGAFAFYVWFKLIVMSLITGLTLYGLSVMLCPLVQLPAGSFLTDPQTNHLSVDWACIILGLIVILYTMCGGLWAVLMTDTLQFFVLMLAVLFVVPLSLMKIGGIGNFISLSPEGFFQPTTHQFTWVFLLGWTLLTMFGLGAEWTYIQRFLCVSTPRDAKKSCFICAALYLTTPFVFMLPPMIYRIVQPDADPQEAYILMCKEVLPPGMLGLMVAAMFSATASMMSSILNVNASVITNDVYHRIIRPKASEKEIVYAGRLFTVGIGLWILLGSLLLPRLTTYRNFVITWTSIMGGSLFLPTIWAIWSTRIRSSAVWWTVLANMATGLIVKFGLSENGWFSGCDRLGGIIDFVQRHGREVDLSVGILASIITLLILEILGKKECQEWKTLRDKTAWYQSQERGYKVSSIPAKVITWNLGLLGLLMAIITFVNTEHRRMLAATSLILFALAVSFAVPSILKKRAKGAQGSANIK